MITIENKTLANDGIKIETNGKSFFVSTNQGDCIFMTGTLRKLNNWVKRYCQDHKLQYEKVQA